MVEVLDTDASLQKRDERGVIDVGGYVENGHGVSGPRIDASKEVDVALDAGDENCFLGLGEPQLMQRADAVGVAVEHIEVAHAFLLVDVPGAQCAAAVPRGVARSAWNAISG